MSFLQSVIARLFSAVAICQFTYPTLTFLRSFFFTTQGHRIHRIEHSLFYYASLRGFFSRGNLLVVKFKAAVCSYCCVLTHTWVCHVVPPRNDGFECHYKMFFSRNNLSVPTRHCRAFSAVVTYLSQRVIARLFQPWQSVSASFYTSFLTKFKSKEL